MSFNPAERDEDEDGVDGNNLPSYDYLAEREGPNSRFGRWREWVEKRAAERYADIDEAEMQRRRARGWGNDMFDDSPRPLEATTSRPLSLPPRASTGSPAPRIPNEPPGYPQYASPSSARASNGIPIGNTRISLYNFGSRFLPHSKSPIYALLPIMRDRFLLIGTQDGLSMIDTAPSDIDENSNLVEGISGAIQRDLWKGESVHQLSLLEYNEVPSGVPQGVVVALIGTEQSDINCEKEKEMRVVRMYTVASLANLAIWAASQKASQPVDLRCSKRESLGAIKKHRSRGSLTRNLKSLLIEPSSPPGTSPGDLLHSQSPHKSLSVDSTQSQWETIDELPLRWATDYVSLASSSSKLNGTSVICFEMWRNGSTSQFAPTKLAIATKNHIFLYGTPSTGERVFKFIKDFYTPLVPQKLTFVYQDPDKPTTTLQVPGHNRVLSMPTSLRPGEQLCLFVLYEKKAGLIRLSDSAVAEVELLDDIDNPQDPSASPSRASSIRRSMLSDSSVSSSSKDKPRWLAPAHISVPRTTTVNPGSLYLLTKGSSTHILPSPLPNPINSTRPFKVVTWNTPPTTVFPRLTNRDTSLALQLIALGQEGIEIQESSFAFLSKGKGKAEPLVERASYDIGPVGFLGFGGSWNDDGSSSDIATCRPDSRITGQGVYAWVLKGYQDWRVIWLGGRGGLPICEM